MVIPVCIQPVNEYAEQKRLLEKSPAQSPNHRWPSPGWRVFTSRSNNRGFFRLRCKWEPWKCIFEDLSFDRYDKLHWIHQTTRDMIESHYRFRLSSNWGLYEYRSFFFQLCYTPDLLSIYIIQLSIRLKEYYAGPTNWPPGGLYIYIYFRIPWSSFKY